MNRKRSHVDNEANEEANEELMPYNVHEEETILVKRWSGQTRSYFHPDRTFASDWLEYKRFIQLFRHLPIAERDTTPLSPSQRVDEIWHMHILETRHYAAFCLVHAGFFVHHVPARGDDDRDEVAFRARYTRTLTLYEQRFGAITDHDTRRVWPIVDEISPLAAAEIQVHIKTLTSHDHSLKIPANATVYKLKEKIQIIKGFPIHVQRLMFSHHELDNFDRLDTQKITDGSTVHLVVRLRGC